MKINLAPNVKKEMLKAEFWLNASAAERILDYQEIEDINYKTAVKAEKNNFTDYYFDLNSAPGSYQKSELKKMIKNTFRRNIKTENKYYNLKGEMIGEREIKEIVINCNLNSVKKTNQLQPGILIKRSDIRALPTEKVFASNKFSGDQDLLQLTALSLGTPLLILFESSDQKYYYIKTKLMSGWVEKRNVAITADLKTAQSYLDTNSFLVVTGSRIETEPNPFNPETSNIFFQMGDKIPLVEAEKLNSKLPKEHKHGQSTAGNYTIWLPTKDKSGKLKLKQAIIAFSNDLNKGFLALNRENIVRQAFKMLGERYDWGGSYQRRDCSRFIMDIFRTFGFEFPRNADLQEKLIPFSKELFAGDFKQRKEIIKNLNPGDILHMPGHIMLYLREYENNHYLIHAGSGYGEVDQIGNFKSRSIRSVFVMELKQFLKTEELSYLAKFTSASKITKK